MSKVFYDIPIIKQIFDEFNKHMKDMKKLIKLVKILPSEDVNKCNDNGETPLSLASVCGYGEIVKLLLGKKDIIVNMQNYCGSDTVLLYTLKQGHTAIAKLLLEHKDIDINIPDYSGRTPLIMAHRRGYTEIVELLENHPKKLIY